MLKDFPVGRSTTSCVVTSLDIARFDAGLLIIFVDHFYGPVVDPFAARRPATLGDLSRCFSCRSGEDRRGCIVIREPGVGARKAIFLQEVLLQTDVPHCFGWRPRWRRPVAYLASCAREMAQVW
jgi:hypothetical protein